MKIQSTHAAPWYQVGIEIMSPWEEDSDDNYNLLHLSGFGKSIWIRIPELVKPKLKWVDLSKESWATSAGYTEKIRKQYGFTCYDHGIHIHYGIQPGSWSRDDKKNSDHTKILNYPWNYTIVRHDLLYPNGNVYHRNLYKRGRSVGKRKAWYEVQEEKSECAVRVAEIINLTHETKDGRKQEAKITLRGEEREWRRFGQYISWWSFGKKICRVVDFESNIELGEKAGSWKGGLVGTSCKWLPNDNMEQAFWRWYKSWNGK
jgi:hypothetical protein